MRRRTVLKGMVAGTAGIWSQTGIASAVHALVEQPQRGFQICVAADAPPQIVDAAKEILSQSQHSLIKALAENGAPSLADTRQLARNNYQQVLYSHLILIGLPDDPMIQAAWQREARTEEGGFYIFGYGHLRGDIGYIESDRSPFLHSAYVPQAPFEAEVVTITGSTPRGVSLAVDAFLQRSLVNGVVAAPGWSRPAVSLLDRDPLQPGFTTPSIAEQKMDDLDLIGWTQASEDEYRGVLADCGEMPEAIWRAKYYKRGNWDSTGAAGSFDNYVAGLHRRAYGNTLWMAQFSSSQSASAAAPKIAGAARLQRFAPEQWKGDQISYANNAYPGESKVQGSLMLMRSGSWVLMHAVQQRAS
jgi:hypothetical protein